MTADRSKEWVLVIFEHAETGTPLWVPLKNTPENRLVLDLIDATPATKFFEDWAETGAGKLKKPYDTEIYVVRFQTRC
ncbi:MAG: hypothetical protein DRO11_00105 [Methanobacteriota archaeon]|nr:MAG: hypothetical protein DRO11_00105 [Euryarchaeota archaeon]